MELTISGQPKIGNVFHLLRPISLLCWWTAECIKFLYSPSSALASTGGVGEDRWRQILLRKRKGGRKGANRNEAERRQREMTQQGGAAGWSATRLKPHLFSASLPIGTINQQSEQGKINKNSTAETTAKCSIASLRPTAFYIHQATLFSQSPLPPVTPSILDSFLFPLQVLFLFSSCLPYSSLSLWLMLASHFWVIYIFFESLHLNLKIKTQWRSSGRHTANAADEREHKIFEVTYEKLKLKYHRLCSQ